MNKIRIFLFGIIWFQSIEIFSKPRVSIITSVYKAQKFIEGFLQDIVQQTIFNNCELIIINANSPEHEEPIIKQYAQKYKNIKYICLSQDPGLYAVWNMGIKLAQADLITNANVDDRRNPNSLELHAQALESDASIDLVYSDFMITHKPNETFAKNTHNQIRQVPHFYREIVQFSTQGPQPMWRKSLHEKAGYFNERFVSSGDWEMWARAVSKNIKFKKIAGLSGLYYWNPEGISTLETTERQKIRDLEDDYIRRAYGYIWHAQPADNILYFTISLDSFNKKQNFFDYMHKVYAHLSGTQAYQFIVYSNAENQLLRDPDFLEKIACLPCLQLSTKQINPPANSLIGIIPAQIYYDYDKKICNVK